MFPISDSIRSTKFPFFNLLMIGVTIFVFYLELTAQSQDVFIQTYALIPAKVHIYDFSTLIPFVTAIFLHGGFFHIISNMWFLYIFGDNIEATLGKFRYLLLYFAAGIAGNVAQYLSAPSSTIPALGASGAIAGILGAYFVLFPFAKIKTFIPFFIFPLIVNIAAPVMLGYWFILQLFNGVESLPFSGMQGGVAFWAHIVGFIIGFLFAKMSGVLIAKKEAWMT